ncbi:hypothetical protein [Acrocarpospora sp. B8E8]|uniref:hypothetical protein n=1 Tax=Acrocarpospora sp. B8E8 TaxID=3153572 RepID=UPI00325EBF70
MPKERPKQTLGRATRDAFEEDTEVRFQPLKWLLWIFAVVALLGILGYGIAWFTQPFRTAAAVREKVGTAENVLHQYEHFHDLCAGVAATDDKITIKQGQIDAYNKARPDGDESDKFQTAPKIDRLNTELTALQNQRADAVAKYNADSAKHNRALFKDASLPYRLDDTTPTCN